MNKNQFRDQILNFGLDPDSDPDSDPRARPVIGQQHVVMKHQLI